MKVKGFSNAGWGEKLGFKKENKLPHKKARHEGEWSQGQNISKGSLIFKPKIIDSNMKKGVPM